MIKDLENDNIDPAMPSTTETEVEVSANTEGGEETTPEAVSEVESISLEELIQRLSMELEQTRTRAENYYRKMLRLEADFDNYRRRCQEEKEELHQLAAEKVITNLLPVLDNLELGLQAADKTQDYERLLSGLQLVYRGFMEILNQEGLEAMEVEGQEFDPYLHEAMLRMPLAEDQKDNTIVQELRRGYFFKGKVIRPARVAVARDLED